MTAPFDVAPLLAPDTPPPALKWNGFPKYNFIGGHIAAEQVPVDDLIAASTAVLKREGALLFYGHDRDQAFQEETRNAARALVEAVKLLRRGELVVADARLREVRPK